MANINNLYDGDNIGGLSSIQIAFKTDILSFAPIVFKAGKGWKEIEMYPESGTMKSEAQHTDNGKFYSYTGSFKIHHPNRPDEDELDKYVGPLSIMRVTDLNGYKQVIGTPDEPVTLSRASDTGTKYLDLSHNSFSFTVSQLNPALS